MNDKPHIIFLEGNTAEDIRNAALRLSLAAYIPFEKALVVVEKAVEKKDNYNLSEELLKMFAELKVPELSIEAPPPKVQKPYRPPKNYNKRPFTNHKKNLRQHRKH